MKRGAFDRRAVLAGLGAALAAGAAAATVLDVAPNSEGQGACRYVP